MSDLTDLKEKFRKRYLSRRDKMPEALRNRLSEQSCNLLINICKESPVRVIHSFIPFGSEINIFPFLTFCLKNNIKIITPKTRKKPEMIHVETPDLDHLRVNNFGIRESSSELIYQGPYDLILVPGVLFSRNGYRIGYGGGYYDYFLAQHPRAMKIGVGFPLQLVPALPFADHDVPVNQLVLGKNQLKIRG